MLAARNFKNWNVETAQTGNLYCLSLCDARSSLVFVDVVNCAERAAQFVLRQHNCEQYYNIAEAALTSDSFGSKTLFNH